MKITCEVIRDLLPLCHDEVASFESRELVEEHLKTCEKCREYQRKMAAEMSVPDDLYRQKIKEEVLALEKIKRTIARKRMLAMALAVVAVLILGRVAEHYYYAWERYVAFEDTNMQVDGDKVTAAQKDWSVHIIFPYATGDYSAEFWCAYRSAWTKSKDYQTMIESQKDKNGNYLVTDFSHVVTDEDTETGHPRELREVYYMPEEYMDFTFSDDPQEAAEQAEEIKAKSILIWQKDGAAEETEKQETAKEIQADTETNAGDTTSTGFRPPAGSKIDKNGNIVDRQGNTFDKDGGWQVPEGGRVDANGVIRDKNGNVMGGGAKIGSKG